MGVRVVAGNGEDVADETKNGHRLFGRGLKRLPAACAG